MLTRPPTARPRLPLLALVLALPLLLGAEPGPEEPVEPPVELEGSWHVLVHYRDSGTQNPEAWRWDDRVWVFERAGSRLRWIEYPLVVFADKTGRFETRASGGLSRVLHAWEPSPSQLVRIRRGLEVNPRGRAAKTLRGSDRDGWSTRSLARAASASVVTYTETWSVRGLPGRPVFTQLDVLGGERAEDLEGVTRFTAEAVSPAGDELRGRFERDETRLGRFHMRRTPAVELVKGSGKSPEQRAVDRLRELGAEPPAPPSPPEERPN